MKKCFKCHTEQPIENFYKHPQMLDGRVNKCKVCNKNDVRENYSRRKDYYSQYDRDRQRLSIKRILTHRYNALKARSSAEYAASKRVGGYRVTGMAYLSKDQFMIWAENSMDSFMEIYNKWAESGFNTKLMPSVDRIDANKGYVASNMQWLSKSENSLKMNLIDSPDNWKVGYRTKNGKEYTDPKTSV